MKPDNGKYVFHIFRSNIELNKNIQARKQSQDIFIDIALNAFVVRFGKSICCH